MRRVLVLLLALSGCDVVDIPLASVDAGEDLGDRCSSDLNCEAGQFCEKLGCGAFGKCTDRPTTCNGDQRPECGCDGVTYWNFCLRQQAGTGFSAPGPCRNQRPCDTCPEGSICAQLVEEDQCSRPVTRCFVMPDTCEGFTPDSYYECGTSATQCLDGCAAVRSGKIMAHRRRLPGDPPCP